MGEVGDRIVLEEGRIFPGGEGYQGEGEGSWRKRGSGEEGGSEYEGYPYGYIACFLLIVLAFMREGEL